MVGRGSDPRLNRGVGVDNSANDSYFIMAHLYILQDKNGKFYIGSTKNLAVRIRQHKAGHTQTTRNMVEPKLVFSKEYDTLENARRVERRLKKLKRKDYIEKIVKDRFVKIT